MSKTSKRTSDPLASRRITTYVSPRTDRLIRRTAAEHGQSVASFVRFLLVKALREWKS